jgi:polyisoprenoid-binding protein YceI
VNGIVEKHDPNPLTCFAVPPFISPTEHAGLRRSSCAQQLREVVLSLLATLLFSSATPAQPSTEAPVFKITPVVSKVTFYVKASVKLEGTFEKWDTTLAFTSTDASTGVLDIKIQADSVNTGSTSKDKKLKGEHCFDAKNIRI